MQPSNHLKQEHAIFSNILFLNELLKRLGLVDIVSCRRTNRIFFHVANEILLKRNLHSITFKFDWQSNTYTLLKKKSQIKDMRTYFTSWNPATDLTTLTELLQTSVNFPCASFTFLNGNLNAKCLQKFLKFYGQSVRCLSLDMFYVPKPLLGPDQSLEQNSSTNAKQGIPTFESLRNLLLKQAPNLKSLSVGHCPEEWSDNYGPDLNRLFPRHSNHFPNSCLPHLKNLTYGIRGDEVPVRVLKEILLAAPNLQLVKTPFNECLLETNKFHLVQYFVFYPVFEWMRLYIAVFSADTLKSSQLKTLIVSLSEVIQFPVLQEDARDTLSVLLSACESTLETFKLEAPLGLLGTNFQLPRLPKVTSVTIETDKIPLLRKEHENLQINQDPSTSKYFPAGFQFSDTFPLLTRVILSFNCLNEYSNWEDFFFNFEEVPSVKYLTFTDALLLPFNWLSYCSRIFVNVEFLCIKVILLIFESMSGLWDFKRLKKLNCDIHVAKYYNKFPYLDALFTGFSPETCRRLQNLAYVDQFQVDELEYFRTNPSILQLCEFRQLNLTIYDKVMDSTELYPTMFTHVTSSTFLKCPQLKATVRMKLKSEQNAQHILRAIEGILPAVQLQDINSPDSHQEFGCY